MTGRRSGVLELAVLGLLHQSPMHGYELRKRLNAVLGSFRAFSYGSLYPCLKDLLARGWIAEEPPPGPRLAGGRSKIVYRLTAEGKERFQDMLAESGPTAWDDETFGVHLAFFGQTDADVRLRILEGRRSRLEERVDSLRVALSRTRERVDAYTLELQRHGLESVEREVRWLNELIQTERRGEEPRSGDDPSVTTGTERRGEEPRSGEDPSVTTGTERRGEEPRSGDDPSGVVTTTNDGDVADHRE
jgi:DNA-binding PadR family transcriptional regulator